MRSYLHTVTSKIINQAYTWKMCHCGLKLIGNMHRPRPFYRTCVVHALLHVAKIIQQAWLHRKRVTVKIKQKNLETSFD